MSFYRRRLPHWEPEGKTFFLTWRLKGSLPRDAVELLRSERERLEKEGPRPGESPRDKALRVGLGLFALTDILLNGALKSGFGPLWLGEPKVAAIVQQAPHYWASTKYELHRYVIMPNHAHLLIKPLPVVSRSTEEASLSAASQWSSDIALMSQIGAPLPAECEAEGGTEYVRLRRITQSLKGYTAREANKILGRKGDFWQTEGFDHWIRDESSHRRCVEYIDRNPVEAELCKQPEEWPWGSAGEDRQDLPS